MPAVGVSVGMTLGLFAFDATLAGLGPFREASLEQRMVSLNIFMSVTIGTGLFLAAAAANERRFEAEQARLILRERYNLNISHGISDESMRQILTDAGLPLPPRLSKKDSGGAPG